MGKDIGFYLYAKDNASRSINKTDKSLNNLSKTSKAASKDFAAMGKTMAVAGAAIMAANYAMIKAYAAFDKSMVESLAIMGDLSDEMKVTMAEMARIISEETTFSADKLAKAYYFLASAGFSAEQSVAALGTVAKFAQAGAFDLARATDLLTDAQTALGMSSKDAAINQQNLVRIADVLVKANTLANASVEQFSEALTNKAATALKHVNKDLEEGVAVLAAYADKGVKGRMAGQRLTMMLNGLFAAVERNGKAWKDANMNIFDSAGELKSIADIIKMLEDKLGGMSTQMKQATLATLGFNIKTKDSILTLMGSSEKIRKWTEDLKKAGGTVDEVARKQLKAFSNQMELLKNTVVNVAARIGETLTPMIEELALKIKKAVAKVSDWIKENPRLTATIAKTVMVTGALLTILGPLVILLPHIVKGVVMIKAAALAVNPVLLGVAAAVGAITLATNFFIAKMDDAMSRMVTSAKRERAATEKMRAYRKVADAEDKAIITRAIARMREQGVEHGVMNEIIIKHLKKTSAAYRAYEKGVAKAQGGVKKEIKKVDIALIKHQKVIKKTKKEIEYMDVAYLSQIDQLKILDIALSLTGKSYTGLSINLQEVTKKTEDFEISMLSEIDKLNIASNAARMMGLSLLGIKIPIIELDKIIDKSGKGMKEIWKDVSKNITDYWTQGIADMIAGTATFTDFVKNSFAILASGVGSMVGEMATKLLKGLGAIAGPIGSMIGGMVASLLPLVVKLFESHGIEQAIERENRWMKMNDDLKESLKELSKEMGNTHAATSTMLADIMADSDITVQNFDKWAGRVKEIFIDLQNGYISIDEFMKTMGSSWNKLVEEAQRLGTEGSKEMLEIIREMENKGLKVAEISEYRIGQLKDTAQALQDYALAGGKNIESYSSSLFAMLQKEGVELTEIAEIMGSNMPAGLRKFIDENENALNVISSTQKMMEGLGNSGYLTQEIFNKMQGDIIRAYDSMTEGGKNQEQSLRAVAPMLAKELWYAQQYNYTLDAKTQKMIDDAKAAGINLDNMKTQQQLQTEMNHSLKQLVDVMEEFVGATRAGNKELGDMARTARGIDFNPGDIPSGSNKGGIPEFGDGGHFWVDKPTVIKVGEKTREEVLIRPEGKTMGGDTIMEKHIHLHLDNVNDIDSVGKIRYAIEHDGEFRGVVASAGDN